MLKRHAEELLRPRPYQNPFEVAAQGLWRDDRDFAEKEFGPEAADAGWSAMKGGGGFDLQSARLTADECFAEWMLGLPREDML